MGKEPHPGAFSVEEAHKRFEELLGRAAGEEVIITLGEGALKLVPVVQAASLPKRVPGMWKGKFEVPDSFFDPMDEEELALWYGDGKDDL